MSSKILIVFSLYAIAMMVSLLSCDPLTGGCGDTEPRKHKLTGITIDTYQSYEGVNWASYWEITDTISYYQLVMVVTAESELYQANLFNVRNSIIGAAYACSPVPPGTDETVEDIVITADKAYNTDHPAGSNLAEFFKILHVENFDGDYIDKKDLVSYVSTQPPTPMKFSLILTSPPEQANAFRFTVTFKQKGIEHNEFTVLSDRVTIREGE